MKYCHRCNKDSMIERINQFYFVCLLCGVEKTMEWLIWQANNKLIKEK